MTDQGLRPMRKSQKLGVATVRGKRYVMVPLSSGFEYDLDDELKRLAAYGVDPDKLTYSNLLVVSFDYYRQRCQLSDDSADHSLPWQEWLESEAAVSRRSKR